MHLVSTERELDGSESRNKRLTFYANAECGVDLRRSCTISEWKIGWIRDNIPGWNLNGRQVSIQTFLRRISPRHSKTGFRFTVYSGLTFICSLCFWIDFKYLVFQVSTQSYNFRAFRSKEDNVTVTLLFSNSNIRAGSLTPVDSSIWCPILLQRPSTSPVPTLRALYPKREARVQISRRRGQRIC